MTLYFNNYLYNHNGDKMYLDLVIIFNLIMNINVIYITSFILKRVTKFKYVVIASLLGIIPTLIYLINNIFIINGLLFIIFSFIMCVIVFQYKNIIYTIKNIIYMYFVSILLGGSLYLFNLRISNSLLNIFILIILAIVFNRVYSKLLLDLKEKNSNYYNVCIHYNGEIISCVGFLDTGNKIMDPYRGYPVILLNNSLLKQTIDKYILVPFYTINGSSLLKCFRPDNIYINNSVCKNNCLVALVGNNILCDYDLILNSKLLERI